MSNYALINSPNALTEYSITNAEVGLQLPQINGSAEAQFDLINNAGGVELSLTVPAGTYIVSMKCVMESTATTTAKLQFGRIYLATVGGIVLNGPTQGFTKSGAGTDTANIDITFTHQERLVVPVQTTYFMRMAYCGSSNIFPFDLTGTNSPTLTFTPTF